MISMKFILKMAFFNLFRRKVRLSLTLLSIGTSVLAAVFYYGFMQQSYWGLGESFARSGQGHILIAHSEWFTSARQEKFRTERNLLEKVKASLAEDEELSKAISAMSLKRQLTGLIGNHESSHVFVGSGVSPEGYAQLTSWAPVIDGEPINEYASHGANVGRQLAEKLGLAIDDNAVLMLSTDDGRINAVDITIKGITDSGSKAKDEVSLALPIDSALGALESKDVDVLALSIYETERTEWVKQRVERIVKASAPGLSVKSWTEVADYYNNVKSLYNRIFGGILIVLALVTSLAVGNTVVMSVYERSQEIGIMRAVGGHGGFISSLFICEGMLLGILGSVIGILLLLTLQGIGSMAGGIWMPPPPGSSKPYPLILMLDSFGVMSIVGLCLLVTVTAAAIPSAAATRRNIAQLLIHTALLLVIGFSQIPGALASEARATPEVLLHTVDKSFAGYGIDELLIETRFVDYDKDQQSAEAVYRVLRTPEQSLVVNMSQPSGKRMIVLMNNNGMWIQKENSRQPLRISPAQRLLGQASNADIMSVRFSLDYRATTVTHRKPGYQLTLVPKDGQQAAYSRIELILDERSQIKEAFYYALSGKLLKKAQFQLKDGRILTVSMHDAIRPDQKTVINFGTYKAYATKPGMFSLQRMPAAARQLTESTL